MSVAVAEFQLLLTQLAGNLDEKIDRLLSRMDRLDQREALAFITDAYPELVTPYIHTAANATIAYYAEQPTTPTRKASAFVPVVPDDLVPDGLDISGRWALLQSEPITALQGSATRAVFNGSRDTMVFNAIREHAKWARHASANACSMCRVMATRGAVYTSEQAATEVVGRGVELTTADRRMIAAKLMTRDEALYRRSLYRDARQAGAAGAKVGDTRLSLGTTRGTQQLGETYHDRCRCIAVCVRPGDTYEPAPYTEQWEQDYIDAVRATSAAGDTKGEHGAIDLTAVIRHMDTVTAERTATAAAESRRNADINAWLDAEDDHLHAIAYWENADAELAKLFPTEDDEPAEVVEPKRKRVKRLLADVQSEFSDAMEAGDYDLVDKLAAEMERVEARDNKAAAREAERAAAKAAALRAKYDRMSDLVDEGWDEDEAEAEAFGTSVEAIRRRNFMTKMRSEGHHGDTFTAVLKQAYYALAEEQFLQAERDTNGYMIKTQYRDKIGDPSSIWSMSERDARKYMSDELAEWFDQHGRITFMAYKRAVLDGRGNWRNPMTRDYLQ